jgi:hypothetical protein
MLDESPLQASLSLDEALSNAPTDLESLSNLPDVAPTISLNGDEAPNA